MLVSSTPVSKRTGGWRTIFLLPPVGSPASCGRVQSLSGRSWPWFLCPQMGGEDPSGQNHPGEDLAVPRDWPLLLGAGPGLAGPELRWEVPAVCRGRRGHRVAAERQCSGGTGTRYGPHEDPLPFPCQGRESCGLNLPSQCIPALRVPILRVGINPCILTSVCRAYFKLSSVS